jgi:predicted PurR-regulated permease PerM
VVFGVALFLLAPACDRRWGKRVFQGVLVLLVLWLLLVLRTLVASVVVAGLFAYLLLRPVTWLETHGVGRPVAIFALTFPFFVAAAALLILFLPPVLAETMIFLGNVPDHVWRFLEWASPHVYSLTGRDLSETLDQWYPALASTLRTILSKAFTGAVGFGKGLGAAIAFAVLVPITTFYLLADREQLLRTLSASIPRPHRGFVRSLGRAFEVSFGRYLRGLLIVSAIVGVLTGIGLYAIGIGEAATLGVVTGVLNLIPIVGFWASLLLAMIAAALAPGPNANLLWVPAIFVAVNILEANLLSPRIVGREVGIHPLFVLFSIVAFTTLFGIAGAIIAIPAALFLKIVIRYARTGEFEERDEAAGKPGNE